MLQSAVYLESGEGKGNVKSSGLPEYRRTSLRNKSPRLRGGDVGASPTSVTLFCYAPVAQLVER